MDETNNECTQQYKRAFMFTGIVIIVAIIAIAVFLLSAWHKDYKYSIESYELVSEDGSMAQVNLRVKNTSSEQQTYYVRVIAYKQANDNLVGTGGRYIIAAANSNEIYSFIVDATVSYVDLFDTYVKIEEFRGVNI